MSLAKATQATVVLFGIFFVLVWIIFGFSWLLFFLFLALIFICRNTNKSIVCTDPKAILAPIEGEINSIRTVKHQNLGSCIELSIKNYLYNEGIIRANSRMQIKEFRLRHGLFSFENKYFNERAFIIASSNDKLFALRLNLGFLERRLKFYKKQGEFEVGEELGFSLNSTVDLLLPKDTRLLVAVGDKIKSSSLLGYFS